MTVYYGATQEQAKRENIIRDIINGEAETSPYARQRLKTFLTPLAVRMRAMDELAHLEPRARERIIRRKLTPLDMALSDRQAASLDRAFTAWLILNGRSRSVDPSAEYVGGGSNDKMPLTPRDLQATGQYQEMRKRLEGIWRDRLEALFIALAPWRDERSRKLSNAEIGLVVDLSEHVLHAYQK